MQMEEGNKQEQRNIEVALKYEGPMGLIAVKKKREYIPPDYMIDNIYLGSEDSSSYLEKLQDLKITHILVVGESLTLHFPSEMKYM
jgi:hypothetical protein